MVRLHERHERLGRRAGGRDGARGGAKQGHDEARRDHGSRVVRRAMLVGQFERPETQRAGQPACARQALRAVRRDAAPRAIELLRAARRHQRLQRMDAEPGDMGIERRERRRAAHVGQPGPGGDRLRHRAMAPSGTASTIEVGARRSRARAARARPAGRRVPSPARPRPTTATRENMTTDHDILYCSWGPTPTRAPPRGSLRSHLGGLS